MNDPLNDPSNIVGMMDIVDPLNNDDTEALKKLENEMTAGTFANITDTNEDDFLEAYKNSNTSQIDDFKVKPSNSSSQFITNSGSDYENYSSESNKLNESFNNSNAYVSSADDIDDFLSNLNNNSEKYDDSSIKKEMRYIKPENVQDSQLNGMVKDHINSQHISEVVGKDDSTDYNDFDLQKEEEEDVKLLMLEQIDELLESLKEDRINTSRVKPVDENSSYDEIKYTLQALQIKYDRNHYSSLANEVILSGAYVLESIFDGQTEILKRKPDLRGWSNVVRVKLRRRRYDTSAMVSNVIQEYKISGATRLAADLLFSLILHSRRRQTVSKKRDNYVDETQFNEAVASISDERVHTDDDN